MTENNVSALSFHRWFCDCVVLRIVAYCQARSHIRAKGCLSPCPFYLLLKSALFVCFLNEKKKAETRRMRIYEFRT